MIKIEKKNIKGKMFYYLSEQIRLNKKYKKIQVYLGKNIPKNLTEKLSVLEQKEIQVVNENIEKLFETEAMIPFEEIKKLESFRIKWKYKTFNLTETRQEKFWRDFAVRFIFESNAIEGSKLSQKEVEAIIKKQYIPTSLNRKEVQEVENSIQAFELIRSKDFKLNERFLIKLHKLLTFNLEIPFGYKKVKIVINNKETTPPGEIRANVSNLIAWWKKQKKTKRHPLFVSADFHNKFEFIHPFTDGNGRVGRLLFIWMLLQIQSGVLLFKNKNRQTYFQALNQADEDRSQKWYWHCLKVYKRTMKEVVDF